MIRNFLMLILLLSLACCKEDGAGSSVPDWSKATHSSETAPDYQTVFPQDQVRKLEITLTASDWENIKTDMKAKIGTDFGVGSPNGGAPPVDTTRLPDPNGGPPKNGNPEGNVPPEGNGEPDYFAVSLKANGLEWYKVGFRLKGNSSLSTIWRKGSYKLPFRLNFDEFEDQYPEIKNQRFYGFKELSMSPGHSDNSLIREKLASDIFREAGVPAAKTAFYQVYINFGEGLKYCGIYTMVETVDDTMIKNQFGEDNGNIYKPESLFTKFDQTRFEKKNNKDKNDFSDVQATIEALNASERTTDPEKWRTNLEKYFNADHFLKWLAINTTIVNWDSYGILAHNHYLYHHSTKGLMWIPWDHNEAMLIRSGKSGGTGGPGRGFSMALTEVNNNWPLIRYLIDDPVYKEKYNNHVRNFTASVFSASHIHGMIDRYSNLIAPYVIGPEATEQKEYSLLVNLSDFTAETSKLKQHVTDRIKVAQDYLK